MKVENVRVESLKDGRIELRAAWGDQEFYYRLPSDSFNHEAIGDALLLSTLAPAMRRGAPLIIPKDYPVSSYLLGHLDRLQRIWRSWNSMFQLISVDCEAYDPKSASPGTGVGLFFSGGVDSIYSFICHQDEVDKLIVVFGFDFSFTQEEIDQSVERNGRFAEEFGKRLVWIDTNHSQFVLKAGVSRTFVFGAQLSTMAMLLGLRTCYLASGHSAANMRPDGSHPIVDYLFSNGVTEIIHDDVSVVRLDKTMAIAERPEMHKYLRVCWEDNNENCGVCSKCVRTMAALRLAGVQGPFPPVKNAKVFRLMAGKTEVEYLVDMALAAHEKGDRELFRELKKCLAAHDRDQAIRYFDQGYLNNFLRGLYRFFKREKIGDRAHFNLRPDLDLK